MLLAAVVVIRQPAKWFSNTERLQGRQNSDDAWSLTPTIPPRDGLTGSAWLRLLITAVARKHASNNTAQVHAMVNAAPAIHAFQTVSVSSFHIPAQAAFPSAAPDTSQLLQWQSDVFAKCREINSQLDQIQTALRSPIAGGRQTLRLVGAGGMADGAAV